MKFVLFRHAHKGILPFEDPELSLPGFEQASKLVELVRNQNLPAPSQLYVSPKRRASQTFYPLSKNFSINLEVYPELEQARGDESASEFRDRVKTFLNKIALRAHENQTVFACTHFDWIEEAMALIHCDLDLNNFEFSHWAPTQFVAFEVGADQWKFISKGVPR